MADFLPLLPPCSYTFSTSAFPACSRSPGKNLWHPRGCMSIARPYHTDGSAGPAPSLTSMPCMPHQHHVAITTLLSGVHPWDEKPSGKMAAWRYSDNPGAEGVARRHSLCMTCWMGPQPSTRPPGSGVANTHKCVITSVLMLSC